MSILEAARRLAEEENKKKYGLSFKTLTKTTTTSKDSKSTSTKETNTTKTETKKPTTTKDTKTTSTAKPTSILDAAKRLSGTKRLSGANYSSAPVDASDRLKNPYASKTTTTKPSVTTKKYTDYNTETKNAYSKTKSYAKGQTTIASDLSEEERKKRIKEIKAELSTYSTKLTGYSRAKVYGANKALLDAEKRDKERMAELSAELKTLERVGTFTQSEMLQWEIDDAKAQKRALPTINPTGRIAPSQAEAYKESLKTHSELDGKIARLEAEQAEYKKIEKLDELNAHTKKITSKQDFEKNSKYSPRAPKTDAELKAEGYKQNESGSWVKVRLGLSDYYTGEDSDLYIYLNDRSERSRLEKIAMAQYGRNTYEDVGYHTLTDEEIGAFNYLYHQDRKNGTNTAEEYLQTISPLLQQRAMDVEAKYYKEVAKEHPVASSVYSLGTNLGNAMMFPTKVVATATGMYDDMPSIDRFGNQTQAIRGAVSEDMGTVGKLAYNATMSIGDMGTAMLIGGGNAKLVQAIMSSSAGSSTISEAKKSGASDGKALVIGLGSAAIEWATEKYSIEAILKEPKTILGYIGTNIFTEGTEEGASNIANLALDTIVSEVFSEPSEIEQRIGYLMLNEGMTYEEAFETVCLEKLQSLGEDVLVGGLTGAGMSTTVASPAIVEKGIDGIRNRSNKNTTQEADTSINPSVTPTKAVTTPNGQRQAPTTLEQAAMDVVASRNAAQAAENTPIFKASERDDVLPTQEEAELKTENRTPVEDVTPNTALDVAQKEAEAKAINAAFEAGRQNVPREKLNLATIEQEEAYNNGRIEHIKNMPKETPKVPNIDNKTKQAYNVSGKLTDKTKNVLDKKASQRVVGIKDGRAYISDGRIAIPVAESDVEYVKSEWGLTDNENIARVVEETANNEYVPISTNPIEGSVPNIKSAVYVFTTDDGRQIAIQKKYAKYFDGYNLSATFVNGMPYAIKATDAEGNFAGLVMGIRPMDNKTYSLTDTKEVSMKSFKNKPTKKTTTNTNKKAEKSTPMSRLYDALEEKAPSISKALDDYQAESDKAHGNLKNAKGEYYSAELKRLATIDNAVRAIAELYSKGTITIEQAVSTLAQAYADDSFSLFYKERDGYVVPSEDLKNHFEELKKNASEVGKTGDGGDNYTSPEYETAETRKPIVATDFNADKQRRAEAAEKYGLSSNEANMLGDYVGGQMCYILNRRMINGTLAKNDSKVVDSIRNALLKFPEYSGRTYRNLQFKTEKEYNDFLAENTEGKTVEFKAFTSASKLPNGYPLFGDGVVHLVIDGGSGRDIADTFGLPRQQEVIYLPDTAIEIKKVMVANDGNPLIFAQEVKPNENVRTEETKNAGNNRPETSIHRDINGRRTESDGNARNNNGVQREVRSGDGRDGVLPERGKSAESGNVLLKTNAKETPKKAKVVETTAKLNDFGEKIGGARKDQWNSRGLVVDDLESMNDRERDKNVKKDNVWKRPNYRALVEAGGDRGLLWAANEIRKSLQQNVYYGYNATAETKAEKQKLFVETIRAIQSMAENAKTKADFEAMGEKWLMDNGYLEDTGKTYGRYAYTQQFSQNPALSGSNYLNTIRYLAKNFDNLTALADRNQFAVDTKSVLPKGFSIVGGEGSVGSKLVNGEWVNDTSYAVAKGRYIIKDGFATREEALEWIKKSIAKKKGKTRFVPQQLLEVHRKGPDYRNSKSISGQDYIDTFGFKGGEFGNWMSAKDRQVSLDYGFDALKDLADALGIEDADISFGGNLNIAFGARGQGLSGAAAHYENERRVINLTKMNGAGSLGHEWFHALDDFIGGYTNNYATDKYYSLPEKTKQAIRDLITTMQYKDATQEETDLAAQKRYEQAVRGITYTIESEFKWVEPVENGTFKEADAKYYKRKPTKNDAKKYRELFNKLIETGEMKYVEELSALRKEVVGRVIPKEVRDSFVWRLPSLNSAKTAPIQRARKMTDFYTDSRTFGKLHSKDGDYWDSTVEMSARAFACYVADKTNKQNDYLTAHSDSAITLDADKDGNPVVVRAYPVGEERVAINKAFDNLVEALKADGFLHERTQTEKPAEVSYRDILAKKKAAEDDGIDKFTTNKSTDKLNDNEDEDKLAMWTTNRVGDKVKPKSITEIVATIEQKLGINITTGHIQGKGVLGQYDKNTRGIRTKIANNLPVISHELGHYFERTLDIQEQLTEELANELTSNLDERTLSNYPEEKLVREGVAEFTRRFLQNRETAAIDYPLFTDFFLSQLSSKDLAIFEQLADDINAYYSLDADTATSSIRLDEEGMIDLRTPMDKLKEKASSLYQAFIDSNHAIKRFDRATGSNAYMLATNAAYSDAIAGQIVTGDLTDINGQYVSAGLKTVLNGIDLNNKEEYRVFGEYLTVKHGPERLKEGKRVFADDKKNNTSFMERRQAELEAQYPQFEEISERLYGFIRKFYQTWAVDTGLLPKETLEFLNNRWEYYVPFNRVMEKGKGNNGAKRGFANQNNTLNKTKKDGSGRDIKHPVDNLINNIVRMVNAGVRNNVMLNITNSAEKLGADATFLEPVPMPLSVTKVDMTGVKDLLTNWLEESDLDATSKDKASGVVNNLDDVLLQYGRGKAHGNVVTVLKNGNPQAWKINDVELLQSLTSLSPKTMDGLLDAIAITSRFMTANITGNNIVWSIFSNLPRDIGTFFTYSKNKNVIKMARGVGSAYLNKVKGDKANPLYKEFLAMGGGKTSAYTADRNLAKDVRKKISGRKFNPNPIDWIGYVSDIVEAGPRFATYKMMREAGMTPQEAFYESMDITTNFRRSGRISKDINKVVPFFNASVQGLDKFRRWITAEEVKGADRKKAIRNRTISFMAVSAAIAAIVYAINNGDDEKEEQYEQLSSFVKNSYWVIPVGDGKYFAIPKPREIGVLSSFFERCMELGIGENDHAFDEFYDYASENFLPAIANDIVQIPTKGLLESGMGIIGSLGLIGVVGYLGANRDFLGRPIVASGLQNLEPKDQYTDRTSKIAYWLGQAFNGSPEQIDYLFQQILGGWWKYQKALFPVGEKNVDWSLGVGNTYIKDNQYSTDLINWLYDRKNTTAKSKNSNPDDIEKAITAKWDSNMVDFYGTYYKKAKADSKSVSARSTRQLVLDIIKEYQKGIDGDYKTSWQKSVENVCKSKGSTEYMPSVMSSEITDGNDKKHSLSDTQYVEYQTDYLRLYWEIVEDTMSPKMTTTEKADILIAAKRVAREQATERTLKRIGAPSTKFATQYEGVSNDTLTEFLAGVSAAGGENSVKKSEVVNIISGLDTDDDEAWKLYFSKYDEKGSTYAYNNGIGGEDYIDFLLALEKYDTPNDNGKLGTYTQKEEERAIKSLKGLSQKEKAILYKSVNLSSKKNPFR